MAQSSNTENTPSLARRDLQRLHLNLSLQPSLDLRFVRALDEELHRLAEVRRGVFDRIALAGNVQLRTERDEAIALAVDHRRESPYDAHRAPPFTPSPIPAPAVHLPSRRSSRGARVRGGRPACAR